MDEQRYPPIRQSVILPLFFTGLLWLIKVTELVLNADLHMLAIVPRDFQHLHGIVTFPLVHGDWYHLFSNTFPLILLATAINYFYRPVSIRVFLWIYILGGGLLWLAGRQVHHVGASGLVYGFATFLFFGGIFSKNVRLWALSLIIIFLYGGLIWGVLPVENGISWDGHLSGAIAGVFAAYIFRDAGPKRKKYDWEDDEELGGPLDQLRLWDYRHHFPPPDEGGEKNRQVP